jgi:hypothetical protein
MAATKCTNYLNRYFAKEAYERVLNSITVEGNAKQNPTEILLYLGQTGKRLRF